MPNTLLIISKTRDHITHFPVQCIHTRNQRVAAIEKPEALMEGAANNLAVNITRAKRPDLFYRHASNHPYTEHSGNSTFTLKDQFIYKRWIYTPTMLPTVKYHISCYSACRAPAFKRDTNFGLGGEKGLWAYTSQYTTLFITQVGVREEGGGLP